MNTKILSIRLNLDRDKDRQVWHALHQLRLEKGWSYSETFLRAMDVFLSSLNTQIRTEEEIGRSYAEKIMSMTQEALRLALPAFLSGFAVQGGMAYPAHVPLPADDVKRPGKEAGEDTIPDDEIPWDYLGE